MSMPPALLRTLGSLAFALPLLAMAATGANPPTPDLPDFKPEEFRTLACEDIVKNFRLASDIPYYEGKEAQADAYISERCKLDILSLIHI